MTDGKELNGQGAGANGGQPEASSSTPAVSAAPADLEKHVEAIVSRLLQSQKDTRIAKLTGEVDGFRKQLERLEALQQRGYSKDQALDYMELEQKVSSRPAEAQPVGNREAQPPTPAVNSVVSMLGLDVNDGQVAAILRSSVDSVQQVAQLATLAAERKAKVVSPAAQMPAGGGAAPATETKESVAAELQNLMKNPVQNMAKIRELNAKLRTM